MTWKFGHNSALSRVLQQAITLDPTLSSFRDRHGSRIYWGPCTYLHFMNEPGGYRLLVIRMYVSSCGIFNIQLSLFWNYTKNMLIQVRITHVGERASGTGIGTNNNGPINFNPPERQTSPPFQQPFFNPRPQYPNQDQRVPWINYSNSNRRNG